MLKEKWGAKSTEWAEFTGLADDAQDAKLDEIFAKNEAKLQAKVDARLEQLRKEREAKKALKTGVEIDL